jgi:hypothetical protein
MMADTRKRHHGKDVYRKARRAKRKIRRFKMKGKAADLYLKNVLRTIVES